MLLTTVVIGTMAIIFSGTICVIKNNPDKLTAITMSDVLELYYANKGTLPIGLSSKDIRNILINQKTESEIDQIPINEAGEFIDSKGSPFQFKFYNDSFDVISVGKGGKDKDFIIHTKLR